MRSKGSGIIRKGLATAVAQRSQLVTTPSPQILLPGSSTQLQVNEVERDDAQGKRLSKTDRINPRRGLAKQKWLSLKDHGPDIFGTSETGGQVFGSVAMDRESLSDFLRWLNDVAPGLQYEYLTRGPNGNGTFCLDEEGLKFWHTYLSSYVDNLKARVFEYNTNIPEMMGAVKILHKLGTAMEIAIPHSPESGYQKHFLKSVAEVAKVAAEYGADVVIKRMVAGLSCKEVHTFGPKVFSILRDLGITKATLHAHGKSSAPATALFVKYGIEYEIPVVGIDTTHLGSGGFDAKGKMLAGTFPAVQDLCEELEKLKIPSPVTDAQWRILEERDLLLQKVNQDYVIISVNSVWTEKEKIEMGMPDGGESYTDVELKKSKFAQELGIDYDKACRLLVPFYVEFRSRFGGITSVTPGHKWIETGTILSMMRMIPKLKELALEKGIECSKLSNADVKGLLSKMSYMDLYDGLGIREMDPVTIDSLRNFKVPQGMPKKGEVFLSAKQMRNTLKQGAFSELGSDVKSQIIDASHSKNQVEAIAGPLVKEGVLPKEVLKKDEKDSKEPLSLIQNSGKRMYLESAGARKRLVEYRAAIEGYVKEGLDISKIGTMDDALAVALVTGDPEYVKTTILYGPVPSAEGLNQEQYQKELEIYNNRLVKKIPIGEVAPGRGWALQAAGGMISMPDMSEQSDDSMEVKIQKRDADNSWKAKVADMSCSPNQDGWVNDARRGGVA